ncbi:D-alanyl-D-alanine dipeptidase [Emticicia aquatilis]|uniref:D-alanyl-D-alanine dipeptidase n=1 Tax=Emticicia aquatilis TaxID=1537369 RepID=A0A916Z1L7_9BACT|nr:M15 family metallopeptidase [Emticicia aquatilis]GGD72417.1 D-alanyl-D-alanine dipeptidase [Emticicia aquatilis]
MLKNRVLLSYILLLLGLWSCQQQKTKEEKKVDNIITKKDTIALEPKNIIPEVEQRMIEQGLVDIQTLDSTIMVELKYSTTDNFVKTDVYGDLTRAYLQPKAAEMLVKASIALQKKYPNYRLLVYDAARPLTVQHTLWNLLDTIPPKKREDFVASPTIASIHNFGSAVDLTVYDLTTKQPLDMGTKYDFFGDLAYPRLEYKMLKEGKLSKEQLANRIVLREAMASVGYMRIESEWWHFNAISRARAKSLYKIVE